VIKGKWLSVYLSLMLAMPTALFAQQEETGK